MKSNLAMIFGAAVYTCTAFLTFLPSTHAEYFLAAGLAGAFIFVAGFISFVKQK